MGDFVEIFALLTETGFVSYLTQSERWRGGGYGAAVCDVLKVRESKIHQSTTCGQGGLEPPRPYEHWHLKPARLPFRHSRE
jgi:hypothetical protein